MTKMSRNFCKSYDRQGALTLWCVLLCRILEERSAASPDSGVGSVKLSPTGQTCTQQRMGRFPISVLAIRLLQRIGYLKSMDEKSGSGIVCVGGGRGNIDIFGKCKKFPGRRKWPPRNYQIIWTINQSINPISQSVSQSSVNFFSDSVCLQMGCA